MSVAALVQRWDTFLGKVCSRADEVCAEADPGFDALIDVEVLDSVPLSSALSEFHARMLALGTKIDASWEKIDAELDALDEDDKYVHRDAMLEKGRLARREIDRKSKVMQVKKAAKAAHGLWALAEQEMLTMRTATKCTQCGAPIEPSVLHEASNVTCPHCKSVSVVRPGMATMMYFQGVGLHAFGEEAALDESAKLEDADERYKNKREKRKADVKAWVDAHRKYWRVYARGYGLHVPGWSEEKANAMAEAKLGGLKWELESVETVD